MADNGRDFGKLIRRMLMVAGVFVFAIVLMMLMTAEEVQAGTINVPSDYTTIQQAIDNAIPGDIITVDNGTYTEGLNINKSLTIQGEHWSNTTINGEHLVNVSDVYINNFTLNNSATYLIIIDASSGSISNVEVTNCTFNLVGWSGVHIGGDSGSGNLISNVSINSNIFYGPPSMDSNPFKIGGTFATPASQSVDDLEFVGNTVYNSSIPINLQDSNINNVLIDGNTFQNTDGIVYVWGGGSPTGVLSNFVFTNNDVDSSNSYGVGIGYPDGTFTSGNFGAGNKINFNSFDNVAGKYGIWAVSNFMGGTLDATKNWWGDISGPSENGSGTGSPISLNVDYSPWWRADYVGDPHITPWRWGLDENVQEAIDAASTGDILLVNSGTYAEDITVDKGIIILDCSFTIQGKATVLGTGKLLLWNTSLTLSKLTVEPNGIFRYFNSMSTMYVGDQDIYGTAEWWEARVVTGDITIHDGGILYVNSTQVNMNCSFNGEYRIRVNSTGELITVDNGTGRSEITAYDTNFFYNFFIFGALTSSDTDITYGWEVHINSLDKVTIGNNVVVQYMFNNGINVAASSDVWVNNSFIVDNAQIGLVVAASSTVRANGANLNFNGENGVYVDSSSTFIAANCVFNGNIAGSGAIVVSSSIFTGTNCLFDNNNIYGLAVADSTASLTDSSMTGNGMVGLLGDGATYTINNNTMTGNLGWDVYCSDSMIYSTKDTIGNMMLERSTLIINPGIVPVSVTNFWVFYNCTDTNNVTFRTNITVQVGGMMVLGNTTLIMDSTGPWGTVTLDVYGTFQGQLWDGNPSYILGVGDVPYYFRAWAGSYFWLTESYLTNAGTASANLDETGLWINTDDFIIKGNVMINNYNGLVFEGVTSLPASDISGNAIISNTGSGIYVESSVFPVIPIHSNLIDNNSEWGVYWHDNFATPALDLNTISNNTLGGVRLDADMDVTITPGDMMWNTIRDNGGDGLSISAIRDIDIQLYASDGNVIDSNIGDGVDMSAGRNLDVNIAAGVGNNQGTGYRMFAVMRITANIYNSFIDNNTGYGIYMESQSLGIQTQIYNNIITNNGWNAVLIAAGGAGTYVEITNNSIDNNGRLVTAGIGLDNVRGVVSSNSITNTGHDGLHVNNSDLAITNNIINSNGNNGITLITSDSTCSDNSINWNLDSGIYIEDSGPMLLSNHLEGNNYGIWYVNSFGTATDNTIISNNLCGIMIIDSNPTIAGNIINSNSGDGIYMDPSAPTITGNLISGNSGNGIFAYQSAGLIDSNLIVNNGLNGIYMDYSNPLTQNNTISGNTLSGVYVFNYSSPQITGNTITFNDDGISVVYYSAPTIMDNEINSNTNSGIFLANYAAGSVTFNTINSNALYGVYVEDSTAVIEGNTIMGNDISGIYAYTNIGLTMLTVKENTLSGNFDQNIYLWAFNFGLTATIADNIIENSILGYGIYGTGNSLLTAVIEDNIIRNNYDTAIYMENVGNDIVVTISANQIYNNINGYGIELFTNSYSIHATISDNQITAPYYDGVNIDTGLDIYLDMIGNTIIDSQDGYGVYLNSLGYIFTNAQNNQISSNYYTNFMGTSPYGYYTMIGNDISNSIWGSGIDIVADFEFFADISNNILINNYDDNIFLSISSNQNPADTTIVNNDLSGSIIGVGVYIFSNFDIIALVQDNDLSGNYDHNLWIDSNGMIDAYITGNDVGSGSAQGRGIYLDAEGDIFAVIDRNDLTGNYLENIYAWSNNGNGYFTITDNVITNSVDQEGIYIFTYYNMDIVLDNNDISNNYDSNVYLETSSQGLGDISASITNNIINNSIGGYGIYIYAAYEIYNTIITDNWISGNLLNGLYAVSDTNNWINVEITHNYITLNGGIGIYCDAGYEICQLDISYNIIADNDDLGLYLIGNFYAESITISYNSVTRNNGDGMYLYFSNDIDVGFEVIGNTVTNNYGVGVYFQEASGSIYGAAVFNNNYIADNWGDGLAISVNNNCYNLQVNDNILENNGGEAIWIYTNVANNQAYHTDHMQISGNTLIDHNSFGISLRVNYNAYTVQINDNNIENTYYDGMYLFFSYDLNTLQMNDNTVVNCAFPEFGGIYLFVGNRMLSGELLRNTITNIGMGEGGYGIYVNIYDKVDQWAMNFNIINQTIISGIYFKTGYAETIQINDNTFHNTRGTGIGVWANSISGSITGFELNRNTVDNAGGGMYLDLYCRVLTIQINDNVISNTPLSYGFYLVNWDEIDILEFQGNTVDNTESGVRFDLDYAPQTIRVTENIISDTLDDWGFRLEISNTTGFVTQLVVSDNQIVDSEDGILITIYCDVTLAQVNNNIVMNTAWEYAIQMLFYDWVGIYEMNGNNIDNSDKGVYLHFDLGVDEVVINDNEISAAIDYYGLYLWAGLEDVTSLQFNNNIIENTADGVYISFSDVVWNMQVTGNTISNVAQNYGLYFEALSTVYMADISNNHIFNTYFDGMYLSFTDGPFTLQLNSNTIMNSASDGLYLSSGTSIHVLTMDSNTITNNDGYGAYLETNFDLTIDTDKNEIANNFDTNLYMESISGNLYATITDSVITNSIDDMGIQLLANGDLSADIVNNDLSGNNFENLYVYTPSGLCYITLINNDLSDSTYSYGAYLRMGWVGDGEMFVTAVNNDFSNNFDSNLALVSDGWGYFTITDNDLSGSTSGNGLEMSALNDISLDLEYNIITGNYMSNVYAVFSNGILTLNNNDISNSLWDYGMYLSATGEISASIDGNTFSSNYLDNILVSCGYAYLDVLSNDISNSVNTAGLHVIASSDIRAVIEYNDVSYNWGAGIHLECTLSIYSYINDNNITNNYDNGMHLWAASRLDGVVKENEVHGNLVGIALAAGTAGGDVQVYDNSISGSPYEALYAYNDISGTFHDNTFYNNNIGISITSTQPSIISGNTFSYNNYDIMLGDTNTTISYNHFEYTSEVCIQTDDSWPTIAWNTFENIGWELRNPPAEPQKVMQIEFTSGTTKSYPPVIMVFNTVGISLAESLYAVNANIQIHACSFDDTPYANIVAINSSIWVYESTLITQIELENNNTIVKMIDTEFDQASVIFVDEEALLDVGYTTDVLVLDQFGEPQVDLEINITNADGEYTFGFTDTKGYFNETGTTAYRQSASGKDYSMNPHTITVRDGLTLLTTLAFDVHQHTLKVIVLNDVPSLILPASINFNEDTKYMFDLDDYASDDGGVENLVYIHTQGMYITVTMDSNNVITFTAPENWNGGPETIIFRATDALGLFTEGNISVTVDPVEDAPILVMFLPDVSFEEDGGMVNAFDLDTYFSDVDSTLTFIHGGATNIAVTINPITNTVSFSSLLDWSGVEDITFTASDGTYNVEDTIRVTVDPVNDVPTITTVPDTTAEEDRSYNYPVDASDADEQYGDVITYSLTTSPTGMDIDSITGVITWTPTYEQALTGTFDVTVKVTDSQGAYDDQSFQIVVSVVNEPPYVTTVILSTLAPKEGDMIEAACTGGDLDGDPVTYLYQWHRNGDLILGATEKNLTSDHFSKDDMITVIVTPYDGEKYGEAFTSLPVVVVNSAPKLTGVVISPQNATEIDDLIGMPIGFMDPDDSDTTVIYYYGWSINGVPVSSVIENTLDASYFGEGDIVTVTVTPSDGEDDGNSVTSAGLTIQIDPTDSDGDGRPDAEEPGYEHDYDNDGVPDVNDAFPYDETETGDIDGDGIGDRTDPDRDGDGVRNALDAFINDSMEWNDADGDQIGDNADPDDDNDGYYDTEDAFPYDENEHLDMDGDGEGDSTDIDRDGDGVTNGPNAPDRDDFPDNSLEWNDNDNDGIGDNADPDDDNDKVVDWEDYAPLDSAVSLDPFWWWWIVIVALIIILMFLVFLTRRPSEYERLPEEEELLMKEPRKSIPEEEEVEEELEEEPEEIEEEVEEEEPAEEEEAEEPEEVAFEEEPVGGEGIGEMLAEAEAEIKELGLLTEEGLKTYSDGELEAMEKTELIGIAESRGLSTEGTRFAILSRIRVDQKVKKAEEVEEKIEEAAEEKPEEGIEAKPEEPPAEKAEKAEDKAEEAVGEETREEAREEEIECPSCGRRFTVKVTKHPQEISCPHCGVSGTID